MEKQKGKAVGKGGGKPPFMIGPRFARSNLTSLEEELPTEERKQLLPRIQNQGKKIQNLFQRQEKRLVKPKMKGKKPNVQEVDKNEGGGGGIDLQKIRRN